MALVALGTVTANLNCMNLVRIAALTVMSALTVGCAGEDVFFVDERFSAEECQAIQSAADLWETSSHGALHVNLVFGARVDIRDTDRKVIVKTTRRAAENRFPEWRGKGIAWHHTPQGPLDEELIAVYSDVGTSPERMILAVAHEMGHHFGAGHSDDPSTLMYPTLEGASVTCTDLAMAGAPCQK